jgi:hypothetical protein
MARYKVMDSSPGLLPLRAFLVRIERQYGKAQRVWWMDRGVPTEAVLEEMRGSELPVQYLVGVPGQARDSIVGRRARLRVRCLRTATWWYATVIAFGAEWSTSFCAG